MICRERRGAFIVLRATGDAENELKELLPDPDEVLMRGHGLSGRGNNCSSALVSLDKKSYVLKVYYYRGWYYGLRHLFRKSRARRNWVAANAMRARGVETPRPLLSLDERVWGVLKRCYILFEYLPETRTLSAEWQSLDFCAREKFMTKLGMDLGKMHRSGCIHGDTNWDNILVESDGSDPTFHWVDLDCSRIMRRLHPRRALKDIGHVLRDLERLCPGDQMLRKAFLSAWSKETGIPFN